MRLCYSLVSEEYFEVINCHLRNWVTIKAYLRYLRKYLLGCMYQDWDLSLHMTKGCG
jgi:hypothetical protein